MSNNGFFVVSLDFELYWGMFDKVTLAEYGENIKGAHQAIPEMLALFEQNNIHATWATVGMLMCENKNVLLSVLPEVALQPRYDHMAISSYTYQTQATLGESADTDVYHYGAPLVRKIIATPHQELASHTFSHYYCIDGSKNSSAIFAADCDAFRKISNVFNQKITSIVFPRNQTTQDALATCKEFGFTSYRGTPSHFLYTGKKEQEQTNLFLRALRLIDTYVNITGHHTYDFSTVNGTNAELKNIQGSWFLRPYSKTLHFLERFKIRRIKNAMTHAAKKGEIYHLWWHPHNFGINRKENMKNLIEIINHFKVLQEKHGMQSTSMEELTTLSHT